MTKTERQIVHDKYEGKCAYTGKPLDDKWQVDHMTPKVLYRIGVRQGNMNGIENLLPACRIINHYKRGEHLESFRLSMLSFHIRLAKLPKKTTKEKTLNRIRYMNEVAELFDITVDKPFNGMFYFEQHQQITKK